MVVPSSHQALALIERVRSEAPPELACLNDHPRYTRRQREVVQLVQGGMTHDDAATSLGVSVNTIRTHLANARAISSGSRYGGRK